MADYDALIIGAGMSGLAAGIRLAHFDRRVLVLDRHYLWGGLNSFYRKAGYRFDVGLHAMTNYVPRGTRHAPLTKLLRQLRLEHADLDLVPQRSSRIQFGERRLNFNNDFAYLRAEVAREFPRAIDGFDRLTALVREHDELDLEAAPRPARPVVLETLGDPLLADMLLCPLMYYGAAEENDMELGQFVVMWKSIFLEGFARPQRGVRHLLELVTARYKELGGALRMRCGVAALHVEDGRVASVELDSGERVTATTVISSAGRGETLALCDDGATRTREAAPRVGALSFVESISVVGTPPAARGHTDTIVFFNDAPDGFHYARPALPVDVRSGVICCPNNFAFTTNPLRDQLMRVTSIARHDHWTSHASEEAYAADKLAWHARALDVATRYSYDFRPDVVFTDVFTPRTIEKFTGHAGGAVYGSPDKVKHGRTHLANLYLCGTDQGFLGIVGAMLSGISIANRYVLAEQ